VIDRQGNQVTLRVERVRISEISARLLSEMKVIDLSVEDPPVEDVIEHVFAQAAPAPELAPKG
jgi:ABC-2 type transport system ATP-binding protein